MNIKWFGTASIEIESCGKRLLFDPFFPMKGSAAPVRRDAYDGYDTVFVTHGHFDHIMSLPEIAKNNPQMRIYATKTPCLTLRKKGIPMHQLHMIDFDQKLQFGPFTVRTYHGKHAVLPGISPKLLSEICKAGCLYNLPVIAFQAKTSPENSETVLYEVEAEGKRVIILGSLNLREEIQYPTDCDLLVLPYNGWPDNYPPAQHVIRRLQPRAILLDHYDETFRPLTRPVDLNPIQNAYPDIVHLLKPGGEAYVF